MIQSEKSDFFPIQHGVIETFTLSWAFPNAKIGE